MTEEIIKSLEKTFKNNFDKDSLTELFETCEMNPSDATAVAYGAESMKYILKEKEYIFAVKYLILGYIQHSEIFVRMKYKDRKYISDKSEEMFKTYFKKISERQNKKS